MKVSEEIKKLALPWEEDEEGSLHCPHCKSKLQEEYDEGELEVFGDTGVSTTKDPCFCECFSETTVFWKCPKCGKPIEEYISWDN